MEKKVYTVELPVYKSAPVSGHKWFDSVHTPSAFGVTGINPIKTSNYNGIVAMRNSHVVQNQENNNNNHSKTYVSTFDMSVEGGSENETNNLEEFVSTFQLPLIIDTRNNNNDPCQVGENHSLIIEAPQTGFKANSESNGNYNECEINEEDLTADINDPLNCSCCSEEVYVASYNNWINCDKDLDKDLDQNVRNDLQGALDFSAGDLTQDSAIRYLEETSSEGNIPVYSFRTSFGEWQANGPPLTNDHTEQTHSDNNQTERSIGTKTDQDSTKSEINKNNGKMIRTKGPDEKRSPLKGSVSLYRSHYPRPALLSVKENGVHEVDPDSETKNSSVESQDLNLAGICKSEDQPFLATDQGNLSENGEELTGTTLKFSNSWSSDILSDNNNTELKMVKNSVLGQDLPVTDIKKPKLQEYHNKKFITDMTKPLNSRPKQLTKHLSLMINDEDYNPESIVDITTDASHSTKEPHQNLPQTAPVLIPTVLVEPCIEKEAKVQKVDSPRRRKNNDHLATDLDELKEMARKLKLSTRRPSYLLWKERLQHHNELSVCETDENQGDKDDIEKGDKVKVGQRSMANRVEAVNQSLAWLRRELGEMRSQDEVLARSLVSLREEMKAVRLQRLCREHQEILEDARELEEERDILGELSCEYIQEGINPTLKHVGLTRMNIGTRRFSVF